MNDIILKRRQKVTSKRENCLFRLLRSRNSPPPIIFGHRFVRAGSLWGCFKKGPGGLSEVVIKRLGGVPFKDFCWAPTEEKSLRMVNCSLQVIRVKSNPSPFRELDLEGGLSEVVLKKILGSPLCGVLPDYHRGNFCHFRILVKWFRYNRPQREKQKNNVIKKICRVFYVNTASKIAVVACECCSVFGTDGSTRPGGLRGCSDGRGAGFW